jgi:hypothetical protein
VAVRKPPLRRCKCGRLHRAWRSDTYCTRCTKEEGRGVVGGVEHIREAQAANQRWLKEQGLKRDRAE